MLIAGYNVYNERKYLPESVASIYDKAHRIIFVDGRYKDFYEDKPVSSTDGTLEWIKDASNDPKGKFELIETEQPWENQAVKRSEYLSGNPGDVYLLIDGHEVVTDWRYKGVQDLVMGVACMARIDLLDNVPPITVKQPRLYAHKEGIKYLTHSYLTVGEDEFYLNLGFDQLSIMPPKRFDREVTSESYWLTLRHRGAQNKELPQRQEQVKEEREKIEVFDAGHGLGFKVDSRVAIDRVTKQIYDHYRREFIMQGLVPITYSSMREIVAAKAEHQEKQLTNLRNNAGIKQSKKVHCPKCGWISPSAMHLVEHYKTVHPEKH